MTAPITPKMKLCTRCKLSKPNDFEHFGKKFSGDRHTFATIGVCKVCCVAGIKEVWKRKHAADEAYVRWKEDQERERVEKLMQKP